MVRPLWLLLLIGVLAPPAFAQGDPIASAFDGYFTGPSDGHRERALAVLEQAKPLTREQVAPAAAALWRAYEQSPEATLRKAAAADRFVMVDGEVMRYTLATQGERGAHGYAAFIDMHGGGGAPPQINDADWKVHQTRYKTTGKFIALRAPRDVWDHFHNAYFHRFIDQLVEQLILAEDVDPNRVYLMGFSSGGYGVIQLAPSMPDRFAAAACSAAATEGSAPQNLRNLPFLYQVGANDTAYGRAELAQRYAAELAALHEADLAGYRYAFNLLPNTGHGFDDRGVPDWLDDHTREPYPQRVVWVQNHQPASNHSNPVRHAFYWLAVDPGIQRDDSGARTITAQIEGQTITLQVEHYDTVRVRLNDALLDLDQPVTVRINGRTVHEGRVERRARTMLTTFLEKRDPTYIFPAELTLQVPKADAAVDLVQDALDRAGDNADQLRLALNTIEPRYRDSLAYLITTMPAADLATLSAEYLLDNTRLAHEAAENAPWAEQIDPGHFRQYILPYACINERRDNWRADFYEKLREQAWRHDSMLDAARWINDHFEELFHVTYHATQRPKPDQSPYESIEAGYASCTGLSIMMIDACRAVGIPARFVGVPRWTQVEGNHNWVEVWDGRWHNLGSSGTDPRDDDWVDERCRTQTDPDQPMHSVYACVGREAPTHFPIVWLPENHDYPAENITRFYSHRRDVTIPLGIDGPATVSAYWRGELVARATGEREVTLQLAAGLTFEFVIEDNAGKEQRKAMTIAPAAANTDAH